jgi:hypothetical protein
LLTGRNLNKYCGKDKKPGLVSADFNSDGYADYAALIKKEQKNSIKKIYTIIFGREKGL